MRCKSYAFDMNLPSKSTFSGLLRLSSFQKSQFGPISPSSFASSSFPFPIINMSFGSFSYIFFFAFAA